MAININLKIQKKDLFLLSAIVVFLVGAGFVIAWNPTNNPPADPSVMGHSFNEIGSIVVSGETFCHGSSGITNLGSVSEWKFCFLTTVAANGFGSSDGFLCGVANDSTNWFVYSARAGIGSVDCGARCVK